ncbi:MAG TPA: PilZ domain-containing protein [Candidatus Hydrogenedentes bacterium]|nr:PilZ domain-containing protein [Candidatus Hydrogenedentota bacterium]
MAIEDKDIETLLAVGVTAVFDMEPNRKDGPRAKTIIRGWRKPTHIMLDRPKSQTGGYAPLQEGQKCVLRYLHEGQACAFDSMVLDWDARRYNPYLRIAWPKSVNHVPFRKHERIKLQLSSEILWPDGSVTTESVRDLSAGGCGLYASKTIDNGGIVRMNFQLPDGSNVQHMRAIVRNTRETGSGFLLGLEFIEGQEQAENDITFFVTTTLERRRTDTGGSTQIHRVLVIDDNTDTSGRLKRNFDNRGMEVVVAANAVDGMYRLRMSPPTAVVVCQTLPDLAGVEVCRMIKIHEDFKSLPVFVYGGDGGDVGKRTKEVGGEAYFPPSLTLAPDVVRAVTQALSNKEV